MLGTADGADGTLAGVSGSSSGTAAGVTRSFASYCFLSFSVSGLVLVLVPARGVSF